jgi:hypothetical protein
VKRILSALALVGMGLLSIAATPSPTVSPTLDHVLAPAPAGFSAVAATSLKSGYLTAHDYAQSYGVKATEAERVMKQSGFVDGFVQSWYQPGAKWLVEYVIAFQGGKGAKDWLAYEKASGASDPSYQHADTIIGINTYYGEHMYRTSVGGPIFLDGFVFVKGNDEIGVGFYSTKDDVLALAKAQTLSQYGAAPDSTIPSWLWPENAGSTSISSQPAPGSASVDLSKFVPYALLGVALLAGVGAVAGTVFLVMRVRRNRPRRKGASPAALQLSADGMFWYDGRQWISTSLDAPPFAQRSPDGSHWWDGYKWRPVPPPLRAGQLTSGR